MDVLAVLIPLLPLMAAAIIGIGHLFGQIMGERGERTTSTIATWAITVSCFLALALLVGGLLGKNTGVFSVGEWFHSGTLGIQVNFITTGFSTILATLFSILLVIVTRFSINYMHREPGFHRFFFILCLFSSAMLVLVLSGNAIGTFIGWEIAGLCSYLLISYAYDRPVATLNATRVFVTNRIGDAGFILGIGATYLYAHTVDWGSLNSVAERLTTPTATVIALCFAVAAFAKSVQLPFTPWLGRAMEGPTPSSAVFYGAVMVHSGVYLVILLEPIFERAPAVMLLMVIVGLITAIYSFVVGLTQTDVKSSLCFATSGQLGLMFLECGLGLWQLAGWHLCAHAIVRGYQVLTAPSLMHNVLGNPIKPVSRDIAGIRWLYIASIQRFWLDPIADRALVRPVQGLGRDLGYFDDHIVDRVMGTPARTSRAISSLVQLEKRVLGAQSSHDPNEFSRSSGMAGKLFQWTADIFNWFEDRLVLRGIGIDAIDMGRELGYAANKIEKLILKPRYLVVFVAIVLLLAAGV
jgi:NADH:ubiquinone oxidoreductase subunit 5 (subunit L)/multisubunit Na+/H+ antiporter MnhA subunit